MELKLNDLLQYKDDLVNELQAIRDLSTSETRSFTEKETERVEEIERSLPTLEENILKAKQIEIEAQKEIKRSASVTINNKQNKKMKNSLELVRGIIDNNGMQTDAVRSNNSVIASGVNTNGIFISRYTNGTDGANISPVMVNGLNILEGIPALWAQMGPTVYNGLNGGTMKLPFMDPMYGSNPAETAGLTEDTTATDHVELSPSRFGTWIKVTREGLATYNQATWDGIVANAMAAADRKLTATVFSKVLADATEIASITSLSKSNFDLMEGSVAVDGGYLSHRSLFFASKAIAIDGGSGRFLVNRLRQDVGETYEGTPYFHSGLAATTDVLAYGSLANIAIGFWGNDAYEMIVDPYTLADTGYIRIFVARVADVKVVNGANAFVKSATIV